MNSLLALDSVSFAYRVSLVLDRISLRLGRGELVGIAGPNGSGKTTLLKLLAGLLSPKSGTAILNSMALHELNRREIAKAISLVPQDAPFDTPFTVREVVAMGRNPHLGPFATEKREDRQAIESAMEETDLLSLADRSILELSSGERKRTFIARALAQETPVILLDEPTANLDPAHELAVMELLKRLQDQGHLVILALHNLSLAARYCSRVTLLHQRKIAADGSPASVLSPEVISQVFSVQAEVLKGEKGQFEIFFSSLGE